MNNQCTQLLTVSAAMTLTMVGIATAKPAFEDVPLGKNYLCMDSDSRRWLMKTSPGMPTMCSSMRVFR